MGTALPPNATGARAPHSGRASPCPGQSHAPLLLINWLFICPASRPGQVPSVSPPPEDGGGVWCVMLRGPVSPRKGAQAGWDTTEQAPGIGGGREHTACLDRARRTVVAPFWGKKGKFSLFPCPGCSLCLEQSRCRWCHSLGCPGYLGGHVTMSISLWPPAKGEEETVLVAPGAVSKGPHRRSSDHQVSHHQQLA